MAGDTRERELIEMGFKRTHNFERGPINSWNIVDSKVVVTIDKSMPFVAAESLFKDAIAARRLARFFSNYNINDTIAA